MYPSMPFAHQGNEIIVQAALTAPLVIDHNKGVTAKNIFSILIFFYENNVTLLAHLLFTCFSLLWMRHGYFAGPGIYLFRPLDWDDIFYGFCSG